MASRLLIHICLAALISLLTMRCTNGFTPADSTNRLPSGQRKDSQWTMYMPSSSPTSQTPPITAQKMLKTVGFEQERGSLWKLSNSILASCDTLPSFPTAHGLLSPETVSRMDENTEGSHRNEAVAQFLESYRRNGPMSCLSMLSDPEVLPHLTEAMRDIVL
jgi:hypothetical protein